ncbi:MAG TPA: hypothetical protein VI483_02595 [Candidatus Paceibacterota bacterium]
MTLTKKQIERQDFVDNSIFELINDLLPSDKKIDWDIELIANVRETIRKEALGKSSIADEKGFYPFIKIYG